MAEISFTIDEKTAQAIDDLMSVFGVSTRAEVIKRALALARVAARSAGSKSKITITGSGIAGAATNVDLSS